MKLDITDHHFLELQKKGYTIDMVLLLSWVSRDLSIEHIIEASKKVKAIYKTMQRKDLVTEEGKLTKIGMEIIDFISNKTNKTLIKPKPPTSDFDKWWDVFPSNDKFTVKGKHFNVTRSFKASKEEGRRLFNKLVIDGEYTAEQIITATEYDINLKKEHSYKEGVNKLKFLQNSSTYLRQTTFSGFIGMGKKDRPKQTTRTGSIDI